MALRNRKSTSTDNVVDKSKKSMKRAKRDINNTSMANSKYGAILGIFIILFGIIYAVIFGNYIYKRKTGHPSALNQANPNPFNFANLDMETLKQALKVDQNGKVTFSKEDFEKIKESLNNAEGSSPIPSKENGGEEYVEEVGNDDENGNANGESDNTQAQAQAQEQEQGQAEAAKAAEADNADKADTADTTSEKKKNE
ncbi:hypothetical protein LY90DRAFT_701758 [Neocallimastix californiae]|jgi:hypothetical protein|uniref:Uncharacterized protein n=1 Tax=Neocallimastix californiae TaxID=1754190 RepID=A0A1Y2DBX0_9FUNG|nr:hypothetical protein LY90DRAFT_701758 [Neocallimastix californiae]|eukprot:ORY56758.1 hypothetical protein LY90DRAFT_701758 [Neocallimastix californiae]